MAVLVLALGAIALIRRPIPPREGRDRLPGLSAPAEVKFDRRGTPHVRAATEEDAYRVLGWLHAADRLFQMEMRRRAAAGRLAEVLGPGAVHMDESSRRADLGAQAKREFGALSTAERRTLEAYSAGVNAYASSHPLPWELVALSIRPEPWTALDSLRFLDLMFTDLSGAESEERTHFSSLLRAGLGPLLVFLDAGKRVPTFVAPEARYPLGRTADFTPVREKAGGSNAWAIAGSRAASGHPMLASDAHLAPEIPGVWYAAHLTSADGLDVAGLTLPGLPGVAIGHNGAVAWGITMHQADDADLFLERLDDGGATYESDGKRVPVQYREESIRVKGGKDRLIRIGRTRHGPILYEVLSKESGKLGVSLAWAPALGAGSAKAFLRAARAASPAGIVDAWSFYQGPSVNVCWASADGRIGLLVAGAVPARRKGDGVLPVPGWTPTYDWDGLVAYGDLPRIEDPPEGFVASANDDWSASGVHPGYPGSFATRERVDRIREVLASLHRATPADFRALQNDVLSPYAVRVRDALLAMDVCDPVARRALSILAAWDARALRRGPALLFYTFMRDLRRRVFDSREAQLHIGLPVGWGLMGQMIDGTAGAGLWDDPETGDVETREATISASLAAAIEEVEAREGPVSAAWNWGHAHALLYVHPFAEAFPSLGRLLNVGPIERPGDSRTVSVASFGLGSTTASVRQIASARLIVDLGNPDASTLVLPLGQSGQFPDRRYDDQAAAWAEGRDFPFPFHRPAVDAAAESTLRLE